MAKHIGIVACSAEGAALCYRTICVEAQKIMGEYHHPEVTMHTYPLDVYIEPLMKDDWEAVGVLLASSASKVAQLGAAFAICPDNTVHQGFEAAVKLSPIPWLHIADVVAEEAQRRGFNRLGVLGTKYLMAGPVYATALDRHGITYEIPDEPDRERVNRIIMDELVHSVFTEPSRQYYNEVIQTFKDHGCDAAVLGCTEIPLLVDPHDCPLPTLDSTRLLARAAIGKALEDE